MQSAVRDRMKARRKAPVGGDFRDVATLSRMLGALIVLLGALVALTDWVGGVGVACGVLLWVLGYGLRRFRMWAWYLGVAVLMPICGLGGTVGQVLVVTGAARILGVALVASASYVGWVLLSKGGRKRYREIRELMGKARDTAARTPR
ncbi:MAG: hypothetical protein FJ291_33330 [Planctomycetes bacterium]|nr:hypothetical protein [Planctomycetota bacterium]